MRILITDGEQRAALALVRSLGGAGYQPFVVSARTRCLAASSRFAAGHTLVPDALTDTTAFAAAVARLVRAWRIDVVIPTSEAALLGLLPVREQLDAVIPFPPLDVVRAVCDKQHVISAAAALGIATPAQLTVTDAAAAATIDLTALTYPVVLKPARSIGDCMGVRERVGVSYAATPEQLRRRVTTLPRTAFPLLIQQRVVGPGVGVFLLTWDGALLASFSHQRLREKPPSGGVSVYAQSIPADPSLVAQSHALLRNLQWNGVAMVEYKVDAATSTPYLMEVNGRFWGSLQLAISAGVDFPALLVRAVASERPAPVTHYTTGIRNRWWWGDVDQLIAWLRSSASERALFQGSSGRTRAVIDFLKWRPGDQNEVFRWSDPGPVLRESWDWLRRR